MLFGLLSFDFAHVRFNSILGRIGFGWAVAALGTLYFGKKGYGWKHPDFVAKCPKSVLQCTSYYNEDAQGYVIEKMKPNYRPRLRLFIDLDKAGFDIVALPTNWVSKKLRAAGRTENSDNSKEIVKFCRANVSPEHLKGYVMASWMDCRNEWALRLNCAGIDQLADAIERP